MAAVSPQRVPLGIVLIAGFYAFGALVLLIGLIVSPDLVGQQIADRHGLPVHTGPAILPIVATLSVAMAYGLLSLSRWGFILTLTYIVYFGGANLLLVSKQGEQPYVGNVLWAALVVLYLLRVRRHFGRMPPTGHANRYRADR